MLVVAPRRGAWIEIPVLTAPGCVRLVAPRRGAWIEILTAEVEKLTAESLPAGERGLK